MSSIIHVNDSRHLSRFIIIFIVLASFTNQKTNVLCMSKSEKNHLKGKVIQMFDHAFQGYMNYAFPADEIMPISCKGRYRSLTRSRGDIDEVLGNYSLTLVDTLDTLALLGKIDEFDKAVKNVITHVHFDRDIIVSVFESNIRMIGGLLGAHVSLIYLREKLYKEKFAWYDNELLSMANDLGNRLLPAFNTTSGLPMSRVNLKYGLTKEILYNEKDRFTCTACAGTLLLEFATLSRLTGNRIFEEKARQALEILWDKRNRMSDLVGTVINIENSEWAIKDSNIGAGIDSYYEYLFKGYVLLGDNELLDRFNKHYDSLNKYNTLSSSDGMNIGDGSFLKTVSMNMPTRQSKSYIDSLLAFWPGLQVMKGDIKGAIKMHETLHQIIKKHDFLPEAVLFDHSAHWVGHPLRPEFLESTYYLYKATNDDHYLEIAKKALNQLEKHSRVRCGYAAISDVRTKSNEDRMDSFVFAELFKYFFLIFSEDRDLLIDLDEFIFTTEAHILPIKFKDFSNKSADDSLPEVADRYLNLVDKSCPSLKFLFNAKDKDAIRNFRESVLANNKKTCDQDIPLRDGASAINLLKKNIKMPLKASEFVAGRKDHMDILNKMGIRLTTMQDGRVQLVHKTTFAQTIEDAETGILFMTEMLELSKQQDFQLKSNLYVEDYRPMSVVLMSEPYNGEKEFYAGPAQFGYDFKQNYGVFGKLVRAEPFNACSELKYSDKMTLVDKIIVAKRGDCIFIDKARMVQKAGGLGLIIIDNIKDTSYSSSILFSMSGDGKLDVRIPSIFLFTKEGNDLLWEMQNDKELIAFIGDNLKKPKSDNSEQKMSGVEVSLYHNPKQLINVLSFKKTTRSFQFDDYIRLLVSKVTPVSDYIMLEKFYAIYNRKKRDNKNDQNITVFDETISLVHDYNDAKYLELNLEPITSLESQIESKQRLDTETFAQQIFEILYDRFEKVTNIGELNNKNVYVKALYNYVIYTLNQDKPNFNLTENDKTFLRLLANEIDHNPKTKDLSNRSEKNDEN